MSKSELYAIIDHAAFHAKWSNYVELRKLLLQAVSGLCIHGHLKTRKACLTCGARAKRIARTGSPAGVAQKLRTHCPSGHEYTQANTRLNAKGYRRCKTCESHRWRTLAAALKRLDTEERTCHVG